MVKKDLIFSKGFTLIEMLISIAVFLTAITLIIGAILSVLDTNRQSRYLYSSIDNINFAMEDMTRELRFGYDHYCGSMSEFDVEKLPEGSRSGENCKFIVVSFTRKEISEFGRTDPHEQRWEERRSMYYLEDGRIKKAFIPQKKQGSGPGKILIKTISDPNIYIEYLKFNIFDFYQDRGRGYDRNPYITINIKGKAKDQLNNFSDFSLQTSVSARKTLTDE